MAATLQYVIDVDDKGEAKIRRFDETTKKSFSNAEAGGSKLMGVLGKIGKAALLAGGLIAGALGGLGLAAATADALSFNKQFSGVVSLFGSADKATSEFGRSLGSVQDDLKDMSGRLGTTTELTRVLYQTISSGVPAAKALETVKAAAELAAAGMADAEESAKLLTTVTNSFPDVMGGAAGAADVLFNTVKLGKVEVSDLAQGFGNILPSAQLLGVKFEEVAAGVAALSLTQPAAVAMTNLQNTFTSLAKESDDFKKAGIDIIGILNEKGLAGAIDALRAKFGDDPLKLRSIIKDQQALAGIVPLITTQYNAFTQALESNKHATGAVAEANRIMALSYEDIVKELGGRLKVALQDLAEVGLRELTPTLLEMTARLREFSKSQEFKTFLQDAANTIREFVAAGVTFAKWLFENRTMLLEFGKVLAAVFVGRQIVSFVDDSVLGLAKLTGSLGQAAQGTVQLTGIMGKLGPAASTLGVGLAAAAVAAAATTVAMDALRRSQEAAIAKQVEYGTQTKDLAVALSVIRKETGANAETAGIYASQFQTLGDVTRAAAEGFEPAIKALERIRELTSQKVASDTISKQLDVATRRAREFDAALKLDSETSKKKRITDLGAASEEAAKKFQSFKDSVGLLSSAELNEKVGFAAKSLEILKSRGIESGPVFEKLNEIIRESAAAAAAAGTSIDAKFTPALERAADVGLDGLIKKSLELAPIAVKSFSSLDGLAGSAQRSSGAALEFQSRIDSLRSSLSIGAEALTNYKDDAAALTTVLEDINHIQDPAERLKAFQELGPKFEALSASAKRLGQTVPPEIQKAMNTQHVVAFGQAVQATLQDVATGALSLKQGLGQIGKGLLSDLLGGLQGGSSLFSGVLSKLFGGAGKDGPVKGIFGSLGPGIKDALTGGVGAFMSTSGNLGNKLGAGLGGAAGSGISKALGSKAVTGLFGKGLGAALGAAAPIIGPIAGQLIGKVFGGLFGGTPTWKKVQKDLKNRLGTTVSEGTAQAIADLKSKLHVSRDVAELLSLDKIAAEADISSANVGKFANEFLKLGQLAKSGAKGAAEAVKSIGPAFATLNEKMHAAGLEGTEAFKAMVDGAKQFIGQSAEVTAFFEQGFNLAAEGVKEFIDLIGNGKDALASFTLDGQLAGQVLGDTFEAMLLLPGGARKALSSLGDGVDALQKKKYKDLGLAIPPDLADAISLRDKYKNVEPLLGQVDALTKIMKGLGETNSFTTGTFETMQQKASSVVAELTNGLGSQEEALKAAAPFLQQIVNEANRNHEAVDATTQGYIQQAASLGLVKLAGSDAFAAMREQNNYLLGGIAAIFGKQGAFQSYLAETGAAATQTFQGMGTSLAAAGEGINTAWQQTTSGLVTTSDNAATLVSAGWTKVADEVAAKQASAADTIASTLQQTSSSLITTTEAQTTGVLSRLEGYSEHLRDKLERLAQSRVEAEGGGDPSNPNGQRETHAGGGYGPGVIGDGEFALKRSATSKLGPDFLNYLNEHGKIPAGEVTKSTSADFAVTPTNDRGVAHTSQIDIHIPDGAGGEKRVERIVHRMLRNGMVEIDRAV